MIHGIGEHIVHAVYPYPTKNNMECSVIIRVISITFSIRVISITFKISNLIKNYNSV